MFEKNLTALRLRLSAENIDTAIITDDDNIYYLTGYYDYLHMEFGRPTILIVPRQGKSLLITPSMEQHMAETAAKVDHISFWNDGMGREWREELPAAFNNAGIIGLETNLMPPLVRNYINTIIPPEKIQNIEPVLASLRMIKSSDELNLARHAGEVAMAMMEAGRAAIGDGVAEYEVAMATSKAGSRAAANLLTTFYQDACMSPMTHFLQIMASGSEITKPHHRASTRIMKHGEPVFLCFCGMTNFNRFKLGFDRTFWIGEITEPKQAEVYQIALDSQAAALEVLGPGVVAEDVHQAYASLIQEAGYEYPFRCGRATGFSFLEKPELVKGDKTVLQPGMVLAVDGSVTHENTFRAQVGDSFIITQTGYEQITKHPNSIEQMIL